MNQLPAALQGLADYPQFITWARVADGSKRPTDPRTGEVCDAHDRSRWVTAAEALATGRPVAFLLTEQDPFWFLDIDHCLAGGQWSPLAQELCARLAGCAV